MFAKVTAIVTVAVLLGIGSVSGEDRGLRVARVLGENASIPIYHAMVIGINSYEHWQNLRQARGDAEKVAQILKSDYGFQDVMTLYDKDATKSAIQNTLRALTRKLGRDDALLIYYAGHGYYDDLLDVGYWVPVEARELDQSEPAIGDWFGNSTLKTYLDKMEARHVLVVSDSCFSGSLMRGGRVDLGKKENTFYQRAISQPTRWCVTSGDLETVPDQSVFAKKFMIALQYPPQPVFAGSDLAGWLKTEVAASSGTQPRFGSIDSASGSSGGEFIFLHEQIDGAPTPPAPQQPEIEEPPSIRAVTGILIVESPVDGTVSLNGGTDYRITSDRALRWNELQVGSYTVRVSANGRNWQETVDVKETQPMTVRARGLEPIIPVVPVVPRMPTPPAPAYFDFNVYPASASIYVDGHPVASKRISVSANSVHNVSVQADGYQSYSAAYSVGEGSSRSVTVRLDKQKTTRKKTSVGVIW